MPDFLSEEIQDYISQLYGIKPTDRLFEVTKHYLKHEMDRGSKSAGAKRICMHDCIIKNIKMRNKLAHETQSFFSAILARIGQLTNSQ